MRLNCPDLDIEIDLYIKNDEVWKKNLNRCQRLNYSFLGVGHKYMYNREDVERVLIEAGFTKQNIHELEFNISRCEELKNLETRPNSLYFEAVK